MIKRTVSLILSLALLANGIQPIYAADLVAIPQSVHLPTPPSSIQTRSSELSFKSIETKIKNVLKPEKAQPKVAATYSGTCGTNVSWSLNTSTGKLTISGSGAMNDYAYHSHTPWYSYQSSIKTVVIKNGVTSIGSNAFYGCTGLTSVTIPNSVTSIGENAFYGCARLTSVTIPDSVSYIGGSAFKLCTGLTAVTIPNSVSTIRPSAFQQCTALTSVTIPNSVTYITQSAFLGCTGLTSVTIPASVTSIAQSAFYGCTSLAIVTYKGTSDPRTYTTDIFSNTQVTKVNVPSNYKSTTFCGVTVEKVPGLCIVTGNCGTRATYSLNTCTGVLTISGSGDMTDYSTGTTPWYSYRSSIKTVVIENGVTSIGNQAFLNCSELTSVAIGNSVTSIGERAFSGCSGLTSINVDTNNSNYKSINGVLFNKDGTSLIYYPGRKSGSYAIPSSVTHIETIAFKGCTGLTSVTIPASVTSISYGAFQDCSGLTSVTYEGTTEPNYGSDIFSYTQVTNVTVPCAYATSTFCGKDIERQPCNTMRAVHLDRPFSFLRHLLNLFLLGKE